MRVALHSRLEGDPRAQRARELLASCVHCGFCTAVCPTYQLLGDERDSPRGRIYLVKQLLEGAPGGASTRGHLDLCLTCRACETACPSGVRYGEIVEAGRELAAERSPFPPAQRALRRLLVGFLLSPLFGWAVACASLLARVLPEPISRRLPRRTGSAGPSRRAVPAPRATADEAPRRRVLLLEGCVQPSLRPGIDAATRRVLARAGIEAVTAPGAGCCGALRTHAGDHEGGLDDLRRNVDAWWPLVSGEDGGTPVEAIVMTASGCGSMVRETGERLAGDARYAERARAIAERTRDLSDLLPALLPALLPQSQPATPARHDAPPAKPGPRLALHLPCSLQHAQRAGRTLAADLRSLGLDAHEAGRDGHLCCGSAGTWSVLHPGLSRQLRERKLAALGEARPGAILSANIGCIAHLQGASDIPVRHWIEVVDELLVARDPFRE